MSLLRRSAPRHFLAPKNIQHRRRLDGTRCAPHLPHKRAAPTSPHRCEVDCDEGSAATFDNRYFGNLLDGRRLLRSGAVLVQNATTRAMAAVFAQSQESFFSSWVGSFARLTSLRVKTSSDDKIRRLCSSINSC